MVVAGQVREGMVSQLADGALLIRIAASGGSTRPNALSPSSVSYIETASSCRLTAAAAINDRVKVIHFRSFKLTHLQHFFFSKAAAEIHTDQWLLKRKSAFAIAGPGSIKAIESGSIPNAR